MIIDTTIDMKKSRKIISKASRIIRAKIKHIEVFVKSTYPTKVLTTNGEKMEKWIPGFAEVSARDNT